MTKVSKLIEDIGGEETIVTLVGHFYDLIETHDRGRKIHALHIANHGMDHARIEQVNFLCGFTGGRNYYFEKHGHTNLKFIHENLEIDREIADDWLFCMKLAMEKTDISPEHMEILNEAFGRVATALVKANTPRPDML